MRDAVPRTHSLEDVRGLDTRIGGRDRGSDTLLRNAWRLAPKTLNPQTQVRVKVTDYGLALFGAQGSRGVTT
jgi:hypothetical protein